MSIRNIRRWVLMITLFVFASIINVDVYAAGVHGVFKVVKGKVKVLSKKTGKKKRAKVGKKVYPEDTIITGKNARVKIVMVDKNEINISPNSQVKLEKYEYSPAEGKKDVLLNVIYGKVRSKVKQKYDGDQAKFRVKTPSAVAGVRGTDFLTNFDRASAKTEIITFEGRVKFGLPGAGGSIKSAVNVGLGQVASITKGQPPTPPRAMDTNSIAKFDRDSDAEKAPDKPGVRDPANNGAPADEGAKDPAPAGPEGDGAESGPNAGIGGEGPAAGPESGPDGQPLDPGAGPEGDFAGGPDGEFQSGLDPNGGPGEMMLTPDEMAGDADLSFAPDMIDPVTGERMPSGDFADNDHAFHPPPPPILDPIFDPNIGDICGDLCQDPNIIDNIQGGTRVRVIIVQPGG